MAPSPENSIPFVHQVFQLFDLPPVGSLRLCLENLGLCDLDHVFIVRLARPLWHLFLLNKDGR